MQVGPVGAMGWVSTARLLPAPQRPLLLYPRSAAAEHHVNCVDSIKKKRAPAHLEREGLARHGSMFGTFAGMILFPRGTLGI